MPLKPPKYVETVRHLIYWQYAQLIAKAAGLEDNYVEGGCNKHAGRFPK